ncbi:MULTISPECIES: glycosyltransferase family 4 protein [unclassified Massilia]|uniref:glycosyltransferase family 4 protein n=1 Tax=unclassified Massilia TaxID=2609279 RepID=UPI00177BEC6D|nr:MULTISPECIES: glycosyltransferase family 4 protein [unclassified Massilia]MBD8529902.1 glycosyltransferase family 4 protein [Massilia sp. CFBP 13647]MBD8672086.1 glycosyltransferase family 4 protein [Massilia sp. CFBP 13721]
MNDLVIALNYYRPYVSGLTNVARDVAEGLAARGWRITVVAAQHAPALPREEMLNGVRVVRTPVALRLGKGVISPSFVATIRRESANARVVNIHAPMLEAGLVAAASRAPVVMTYQCDVSLPPTLAGRLQNKVLDLSTAMAARRAAFVTVTSDDYADHSRLRQALTARRKVIPGTCHIRTGGTPAYRDGAGMHVGFLGRIVEEKGVEFLVEGFRALDDPQARLLIAGDFNAVAGGSVIDRVRQRMAGDTRIKLLGFLPDAALDDFYASLDVFALPSINPFEAFGIVQVEAMMRGIPVIASDLPGVRQPVLATGMGEIVQPRSAASVTAALTRLQGARPDVERGAARARALYAFDATLDKFAAVFEEAAAMRGQLAGAR